jgi:hypothetical protein
MHKLKHLNPLKAFESIKKRNHNFVFFETKTKQNFVLALKKNK